MTLLNRLISCDILLEDGIVPGWRWGGYDFDLLVLHSEEGYVGKLWKREDTDFRVDGAILEEVADQLEDLLRERFPGIFGGRPALERIALGESWVV